MNYHSVSFWLAAIGIGPILVTYVTSFPGVPVGAVLIRLAVIFSGK
jgi:hypothetical protein